MLQLAVDARVLFNTWMRHIDPSHCSDLRQRSSNHACKDWVTPSKRTNSSEGMRALIHESIDNTIIYITLYQYSIAVHNTSYHPNPKRQDWSMSKMASCHETKDSLVWGPSTSHQLKLTKSKRTGGYSMIIWWIFDDYLLIIWWLYGGPDLEN